MLHQKPSNTPLCIFVLAITLALPAFAARAKKPRMTTNSCLKTWHIERHTSPWSGLTGDAAAEEATFTVRAVRQRPADPNLIAQPSGIAANDFLLFRSEKTRAVVVNAQYFSDLTRQDATGKPLRNGGFIGAATPAALKRWQGAELLGLLLEQQIILTYAHLESKVCLVSATEEGGVYRAELTGEHVYYTNARNVSGFRFLFEADSQTGKMRVR
ncbi:hypothetical protein Turpa_1704 [Turneriella parva DSM 21527]|uniref:Lipoprotein n=2 Tax=Turneriella TaxID=338321 RepID=I4B4Z5_TURPD|nr:hypothetical protein Turpa_1704 [Turneriella parva DSM 21527]